jgi:hypothetical protein
MLTMQTVRDHLRIDDGSEDSLLKIYTAAGIEAAERITGRRFSPGENSEVIENPMGSKFTLKSMPTGPVVATVTMGGQSHRYTVKATGRTVYTPFKLDCGVEMIEFKYRVGPSEVCGNTLADAPPMIELGILKFIAHAWVHRGDNPNAWPVDSGAIDLWSSYRPVFFG